ncbi:MAG: preprotein translocase subunit YajC, partial [Phycisphaerae bacterium]|nr:preprotein translocase subunit YajC [Phycisphaerae bacterium]NIU11130.1 preprotein translocase subunit YajC [Phycisphaerae bacterium]NIX01237.1 hypothetical protein [Phycisphaerae bacterium]
MKQRRLYSLKIKNLILTLPVLFTAGCIPQQGGGGGGGGSMIGGIIPFVLIFVLFYFLILRPQQKQNRSREEMIKNL